MTVSAPQGRLRGLRCKHQDGPFGRRYYAILYAIEAPIAQKIKIGRTLDIAKRFGGLCGTSPVPLTLLGHVWLPDDAEAYAHSYLECHRSHGEWFDASPVVVEFAALVAAKNVIQLSSVLEMDYMLLGSAPKIYEPPLPDYDLIHRRLVSQQR